VPPASGDAHPTGSTTLAWGTLATGGGATTPSYSGGRCDATYCHGATMVAGGTNRSPAWTGGPGEAACGTCHGSPPPAPHPPNAHCGRCHGAGYDVDSVSSTAHVDGRFYVDPMSCTKCHGDPARSATAENPALPSAPPLDAHGDPETISTRVGAHQAHLHASSLAFAVGCAQCHTVPQSLAGHPTGVLDLTWGTLATGAITATVNVDPAFSCFSTTTPSYSGGTCSATYCHGGYSGVFTYNLPGTDPPILTSITYFGGAGTPSWSGTAPCGSCHGIPPSLPGHPTPGWHSGQHGGGNDCSLCHPDATGTSASDAAITDPTRHIDGKVDLAPQFSSKCFGCH